VVGDLADEGIGVLAEQGDGVEGVEKWSVLFVVEAAGFEHFGTLEGGVEDVGIFFDDGVEVLVFGTVGGDHVINGLVEGGRVEFFAGEPKLAAGGHFLRSFGGGTAILGDGLVFGIGGRGREVGGGDFVKFGRDVGNNLEVFEGFGDGISFFVFFEHILNVSRGEK